MKDNKFHTLDEISAILRVCRKTCVRYITEGRLKATRLNESGPYRISQTALDEFLANSDGKVETS